MSTTRYAVRHFADIEMTQELGEPRFTASWGVAWDEMHCHRREVPSGLRISIIERVIGSTKNVRRNVSIVERFVRR